MTEHLTVDAGTIAYEVEGTGPLIVLAHGMGDSRAAYRPLVPHLLEAGYRVASVDLRAVVRHLGGPAVLVGHSISGGAATIAAAQEPDLFTAVAEVAPFTREQSFGPAQLRDRRVRQGMLRLLGAVGLGSVRLWRSYLDAAYPGTKPDHWAERLDRVDTLLREPGRMKALRSMGMTTPTDAGVRLGGVRCPVLVLMGTLDPDWADPRAEGQAVVDALPEGLGRLEMIEGSGHYPHDQHPEQVASFLLAFLRSVGA